MTRKLYILSVLLFLAGLQAMSQVPSTGIHVSGGVSYESLNSSNIGQSCEATGLNSFAGGYQSLAQGSGSFAFGNLAQATQPGSFALGGAAQANASTSLSLGFYVTANQNSCIVIGSGSSSNSPLTSSVQGIMMGMGSTHPTLYLSKASTASKTGMVAIGDVTPQAKLHIRSDVGEDAGLILVPADPTDNSAFIRLRDNNHHITVSSSGEMSVSAGSNNAMGITSSNLSVEGSLMRIGTYYSNLYLSAEGTPSLSFNAYPFEGDYYTSSQGPSYAVEFGDSGMRLRTAVNNTLPRDRNLIETWNDALTLKTNGAITLNGKVGVNTENTYPGYALAVDGGMITTKVHIQDVNDWQDRVFGSDYPVMPLDELEAYVAANKHLPGVPSETEVKAQGYDMARMQAALLGKIEELVLHTIRQQKEIDSLRTLVTVLFGYDACGNRVSRTLEFSRMEDPAAGSGEGTQHKETPWQASLTDRFGGLETSLFPNPTDGGFILSIGGEAPQGTTAALCTMDGKVIEERAVNGVTEEFDLSGKPAGVYLLRLSSSKETKAWKVIKRN